MSRTPAPWHLGAPGGPAGPFWSLVNPQGRVVAMQIPNEADARLIAAAPDLYSALVDAAKFLADTDYSDEAYAALEVCQAALAKARGEA